MDYSSVHRDPINDWYNSHVFKNNGYDIVVIIVLVVIACGALYLFRKPLKEFVDRFTSGWM